MGEQLTESDVKKIKEEIEYRKIVVRKKELEAVKEARAQGDLSENADYDAARDHQARVEARILELENMIANAVIIEEDKEAVSSKSVTLGSTVKILDLSDNTEETYTIVGSIEADPLNGRLSNISPLAVALMDHKVNDIVHIGNVEVPYDVRIVELK